ncbi:MAG TPA: hypothetical protein VHD76_12115 [Bryobacteraceae bacterium]|jgi:hypothetical protein|nr:hypothetical protein [Bryobacteraceae bacterium]
MVRASKILRAAAGPAILLLLYVVFFWRITLSHQFTWLESPDIAYQVMPWLEVQARAFHQRQLPLWDPYEWGGQSLIGQMQPGTANPLNWILFALPLRDGFIRELFLHWYFVLIHYLGGLFCYLLCRDLKLGRFAAVLGGAAFGMSAWMGVTDWPQMLTGAIWAPLIFLFLLRALPAEAPIRYAGLAGAFLGASLLSGHHQIPTFLALAAGAVGIYLWVLHGRAGHWWEAAGKTGLAGLLAALVGALQALPALEYGRTAVRWVGDNLALPWKSPVPYTVHEKFSLAPAQLLDIVIPHTWLDSRIFLGWALLALAILGVLTAWRERAVKVFVFLCVGGVALALGSHSIFHGLAYVSIPMVEKARSPGMATFLCGFAASVLAAFGADALWRSRIPFEGLRRVYRLLYGAAAALAILAAARIDADALSAAALSALLAAVVLHALRFERLRASTAAVLLSMVALFELGSVGGSHFTYRDRPESIVRKLHEDKDVANFLRGRMGDARAAVDRSAVPYNFGDWYGIHVLDGYTASIPASLNGISSEYWGRMLMSVRYLLAAKPLGANQREVYAGASGVKVFENPDAFPRAWAVHKITTLASDREINANIAAAGPRMQAEAFLTGHAPQVETCAGVEQVALVSQSMNRLALRARMQCKGMVVASEIFAPGWKAYVDGRPAQIWPAYTALRGVIVPAGEHRIEMIYRPASVIVGAMMSALGLLLSLWLLVRR